MVTTRDEYTTGCDNMVSDPNSMTYWSGTCTSTAPAGTWPACGRAWIGESSPFFTLGYGGSCEEGAGPNIEFSGSPGEDAPGLHCNGPCLLETDYCTSVASGGQQTQVCATSYTGDLCVPGSSAPEAEPPEECNTGVEVGGECVTVEDGDAAPTEQPMAPQICIGELCRPLPPSPGSGAGCSEGSAAAICTSAPGGSNPPRPSNPPWPGSQPPAASATARGTDGSATNITMFGAPRNQDAGAPDGNGQCSGGATPTGPSGSCRCEATPSSYWNGTQCVDGEPGGSCPEDDPSCEEEGDGDRAAGRGTCGGQPPHCSGDAIDCSVVYQTWVTRCALESTASAPTVDIESPFTSEYTGGRDAFFSDSDEMGAGDLDYSGFGGGSCPAAPALSFRGTDITMPEIWCDYGWLGDLTLLVAVFIAGRIIAGRKQ